MKRIKHWFFERFLPVWAKETILADYRKLQTENEKLLFRIAEKDAYIDGLVAGIRSQRRIVINAREAKK